MTFITQMDKDRIRVLRGVMKQSGAILPQGVLNLAKPDLNDKKRAKNQRVEREELETKVPRRELAATETVILYLTFILWGTLVNPARKFSGEMETLNPLTVP